MKVAYILKKFPRLSETFILNELLALEEAGAEAEIYSLKQPDDEPRHESLKRLRAPAAVAAEFAPKNVFRWLEEHWRSDDVETRQLAVQCCERLDPSDPLRPETLGFAAALAPKLRAGGARHIHAHFGTIAAGTAAELARMTGLPFSFTLHAKDIYRDSVDFSRLDAWMRASAFAVTVCEANAAWIRGRVTREAAAKLRVLYNGIDLARWEPSANPEREPVLMAVGRLVEKKGFDDFLRACALARDAGRIFRAELIGAGEEEQPLRRLREELGLEAILEMPGALPQEEVRRRMARAALIVAPCRIGSDGNRDALPTVLLEAMALATPCLATPVTGIPEIVRDGIDGWIVDPGRPDALARVIGEALECPAEARRRGRAGRERAEEVFDLRRNAELLAGWFRRSAGAGEAGRRLAAGALR